MNPISRKVRLLSVIFTGALAGLALSACNKTVPNAGNAPAPLAALPLTQGAASPVAQAPIARALPPAPPAQVVYLTDPSQGYAYLDQAYALSGALGDAPPDYAYDYDGASPWVWKCNDGSILVVESTADGDRYYYYQPGAAYPYLVRDANYAYAYDNGDLVVVYDRDGRELSQSDVDAQAAYAGLFLARGRALYQAARSDQRQAVAMANWQAARNQYFANQAQWAQDQSRDAAWHAYHDQQQQQESAHWADEHYRREAEAARVAQTVGDAAVAARDLQAATQEQAWIQQQRGHPLAGPAATGVPPAPPLGAPRPSVANSGRAPAGSTLAPHPGAPATPAQTSAAPQTQAAQRSAAAISGRPASTALPTTHLPKAPQPPLVETQRQSTTTAQAAQLAAQRRAVAAAPARAAAVQQGASTGQTARAVQQQAGAQSQRAAALKVQAQAQVQAAQQARVRTQAIVRQAPPPHAGQATPAAPRVSPPAAPARVVVQPQRPKAQPGSPADKTQQR